MTRRKLASYTWPRTSSDGNRPVTLFKEDLARQLRREAERSGTATTRGATLSEVAEMIEAVVVEGE